jgi:transposase
VGRIIGLDLSTRTAEVAMLGPGPQPLVRHRFAADAPSIRAFAAQLTAEDRVAFESSTNAVAFHRLLCHHAGEVVISNPLKTRIIAEAKVKTDKVDAEILARLLAADFLPPVWVPDAATDRLRHLVFHRQGLVTQRTQAKNRIHAILHRNLLAPDLTDLFGAAGRRLLAQVGLPADERALLDADLRVLAFFDSEIQTTDQQLAWAVVDDPDIRRLLTVPGLALTSAVALKASIGVIARFPAAGKLVSYFGLNPSVHQSGQTAYHGHISRRGRSQARAVCVEVAHQLVKAPGPFHAFFERLRRRKPYNVAITAVARKLVVLVWHMLTHGEDYRYAPPARTRQKLNALHKLATGRPAPRAPRRATPGAPDEHQAARAAEATYQTTLRDRYGSHDAPGPASPAPRQTRHTGPATNST